jgi:hypothetical protein
VLYKEGLIDIQSSKSDNTGTVSEQGSVITLESQAHRCMLLIQPNSSASRVVPVLGRGLAS